jgi:hypothetical protein
MISKREIVGRDSRLKKSTYFKRHASASPWPRFEAESN